MGIKFFFSWFKRNFGKEISKVRKGNSLPEINVHIENLMIDMNGLFHTSAQKVYEYGNFKPNTRLLKDTKSKKGNSWEMMKLTFHDKTENKSQRLRD